MESKARKIIGLHKDMKNSTSRGNWENMWHECMYYSLPNKDRVYDWKSGVNGEDKYGRLFDSSAAHFNELLASAFHGMLTNPATYWFGLTTTDREIAKIPRVRDYLQKLVKKIHGILDNSNFHTEIHELYLDLGSPGTSIFLIDEDDEDYVRFRTEPIFRYYLKENFKGEVDTVSCEMEFTVRQMIQKFGEKNLPKEIKNDLQNLMEKKFTVIQMIMPRAEAKRSGLGPMNKPIASYYVLEDYEVIVKESGFSKWPMATPRFMKSAGEVYGRSCTMKALPDIKMINAMMQVVIRSGQKMVDPPLMVPDDGILGRINTTPGGLNPYRSGTKDMIIPLETKGNPNIGLDMASDVRERIKQAFYIDQLQLREGPQMTATEVNQRTEEHLRLLGPILGRLHHELLKPTIARIIDIMKKKNLLPGSIPPELNDLDIEVHFTSQIAKAQRMGEAQGLNTFLSLVANTMQIFPEIGDMIDPEGVVRVNAGIYGVTEEIFRSEEAKKQIQKERAAQEQMAQQQQMNMNDAEALNKVAPLIKPGE